MAAVDISRIVASPESEDGTTGETNSIYIIGAPLDAFKKGLSFAIDGPTKPAMNCDYDSINGVDTVEAYFVAKQPGDYNITIKMDGKPINGSPFKIKVSGVN